MVSCVECLVARVSAFQPSGNLLRRPLPLELACHDVSQHSVLGQFTGLGTMRPIPGGLVSLARPIAFLATVALELAADRGWRSPE